MQLIHVHLHASRDSVYIKLIKWNAHTHTFKLKPTLDIT